MEIILWIGFYFMTVYALLPAFISRIFGFRVFMRGRTEREIALTFDDGPDPVYTPKLLDLLKHWDAKATFFVVGSHAEQWPEIVARIHEEGHVLGIHNYVHHSNWLMRPGTVKKQILKTSEIVKRITGVTPVYYRPPWGIVNIFDYRRLGHLQIVLWTSIFGDWRERVGADRLYRRMRRKLRPGEVFVLHDCGRTFGADEDAPAHTIEALDRILADGRGAGYRFVGVDEMIRLTEEGGKLRVTGGKPVPVVHPAEHSNPDPKPQPAHRIGPLKRAAVALWMVWEKMFHVVFRVRPLGDGTSFHYRICKYTGPTIGLRDGKRLQSGDRVLEMHFENRLLFEMSMNARSSVQTAIRLVREVERGLPDLARVLDTEPKGHQVAALFGISLLHRGSEGLGFQTFEMPKGLFARITNLYLRFMISVMHPEGGKRVREHNERLSPKLLVMERDDLLSWKDRTGKQRPWRASRAEIPLPAVSLEPGIHADQIGRTV